MSIRPPVPVVSVIVLNWRNEDATAACISSIKRWRSPTAREIIIVDNESTAHSRERLRAIEDCEIVRLQHNRGFAGGMNAGAKRARGEYVALLNNDLSVAEDWLEAGLAVMTDPRVGIVGGKAYCWDASNPLGDIGNRAFTLPRVDPDRGFAQLLSVEAPQCRVAAVDGSNLLIRRCAWTVFGGIRRGLLRLLRRRRSVRAGARCRVERRLLPGNGCVAPPQPQLRPGADASDLLGEPEPPLPRRQALPGRQVVANGRLDLRRVPPARPDRQERVGCGAPVRSRDSDLESAFRLRHRCDLGHHSASPAPP